MQVLQHGRHCLLLQVGCACLEFPKDGIIVQPVCADVERQA